ncbi:MAG: hypothetical protein WBD31_05210 [Rubripirellula sp.]
MVARICNAAEPDADEIATVLADNTKTRGRDLRDSCEDRELVAE